MQSSMDAEPIISQARQSFSEHFGSEATAIAMAPGRLELLGNHTDYNEGLVLGLAIDRWVVATGRRVQGNEVTIHSAAFAEKEQFELDHIAPNPKARWADYCKGVIDQYRKSGFELAGFHLNISSNVPLGAGVSSSAALLVSTALCIQQLFGIEMDKMATAKLCHAAERDFAGANNGLLDHFCSIFGRQNHALFLDCRSSEYDVTEIASGDLTVAVSQTKVKHSVVEGEYQARRSECSGAVAFAKTKRPSVLSLRDVSSADLLQWKNEMDPVLFARALHVAGENERVEKGRLLLRNGDLAAFGELMYESHQSSRENFQNSCPELDTMVDIAKSLDGVYGSRLTGGGFGGCTLTFVKADRAQALRDAVMREYPKITGKDTDVFFCRVSDGARIVEG